MILETYYCDGEGRDYMQECISRSVEWCVSAGLGKLVIFTGTGEGPRYIAKEILSQDAYCHLQVVAVTPPMGRLYRAKPGDPTSPMVRAGVHPAMRDELAALGITVIAAHLPFKEIDTGDGGRRSEWARVAEAYGVLGGGFALCAQAVLMACDAGEVHGGERVMAVSADTAFVAVASATEMFLSHTDGLLVEHIVCRPKRYTVSKRKHRILDSMWGHDVAALPPAPTSELEQEDHEHAKEAEPESTQNLAPPPTKTEP